MTSIAFTGDIAFSKYFKDHWQKDFVDKSILDFLHSADHVVANVEAPLTCATVSSTREINHFCDKASALWFQKIGADIWSLANNHILDCDAVGMNDTIDAAKSIGAGTVGAGNNADEASRFIELEGDGGIGIFAVTYKRGDFIIASEDRAGCIIFEDTKRIKEIIRKIKEKNKWCVLIAHGGDEFASLPMPYIRKRYREFLKMGADIVVGHHPHVVQNYETVGDKMIFYSLGNFVFDTDYQRKQKYSEYGIILKLNFEKTSFSWTYLATEADRINQEVVAANAPVIFCNVGNRDYFLLWHLAARKFARSFVVAKNFVMPKTLNYKWYQWFNFHREKIGLANTLCLYWGRLISHLGLWKLADKELRRYIGEQ